MKLPSVRAKLRLLLPGLALLQTGCVTLEEAAPPAKPSQAEKQVCIEITRPGVFPTWAYDGEPETVANRVDTEVSVEMGIRYTGVVREVCPGYLD